MLLLVIIPLPDQLRDGLLSMRLVNATIPVHDILRYPESKFNIQHPMPITKMGIITFDSWIAIALTLTST